MNQANRDKLNRMLDEMQEGNDFSFFTTEARGGKLSPEQEAAKKRTRDMIEHLEKPEVDARVTALLNA